MTLLPWRNTSEMMMTVQCPVRGTCLTSTNTYLIRWRKLSGAVTCTFKHECVPTVSWNLHSFLSQVIEGSFVKENVDELCWTLTAKKNYQTDKTSSTVLPEKDAFRLWCLFNFLSEDKYPLVMVPDEVGSFTIQIFSHFLSLLPYETVAPKNKPHYSFNLRWLLTT